MPWLARPPAQHGRPTGAEGLNLAVADVVVLARALKALLIEGDSSEIQ
jgi:p-hydroxybenzoate 3-monooxygenase